MSPVPIEIDVTIIGVRPVTILDEEIFVDFDDVTLLSEANDVITDIMSGVDIEGDISAKAAMLAELEDASEYLSEALDYTLGEGSVERLFGPNPMTATITKTVINLAVAAAKLYLEAVPSSAERA